MIETKIKTPQERDSLDLLELVCQLHGRVLLNINNEIMYNSYMEARKGLEKRIISSFHIEPIKTICSCGSYHTRAHLINNKCFKCKEKISI